MNWLDAFLGFVSPTIAAKRARSRLMADFYDKSLQRKYEGASKGRRTDGWITASSNANAEIKAALSSLRDRSRDLTRNNPIGARAVQTIVSNTVGTGIMATHKGQSPEQTALWEQLWRDWAGSTACDADGRLDFYGLQALGMRCIVESGEVLIRKIPQPSSAGMAVPLKIQVLEPDFLDSDKEGSTSSGQIVQGVEFDAQGRRVAYWLFPEHPGSGKSKGGSQRVPADQVLHVFLPGRPGQCRGVPFAHPVLVRMKDLDDFMDAMLLRQKVSACFSAFVFDTEAPLDAAAAQRALGERLEPGIIEILPPGKDIRFAAPPGADGSEAFLTTTLRQIASAFGITYEALSGDYSQVNYSSGRMGWLEMSRNVQVWQWQLMVAQFCLPIWAWFRDAGALAGARADGLSSDWTPPRREMVDPSKEINATVNAVRAGLMSLSEAHRASGYDSGKLLEEIAQDNARLDALGLILDSDPRTTMKAGVAQTYVDEKPAPEVSV